MTNSKEISLAPQIAESAEHASIMKITTPNDMEQATAILSRLNQFSDSLTKEKEKVTKPLNAALKAERERFKPLESMLESSIATIRRNMSAYQTEKVRLQRIEEQKIADRIGTGKGKLKIETAIAKIDAVEKPEVKVTTDNGSVRFTPMRKFEVTDSSLLPKEYITANEVAIRAAMKAGTELPGVRYWTEQVPVNTR